MSSRRVVLAALAYAPLLALAGSAPKGFRMLTWGAPAPRGLKRLAGPNSDGTSMYVPSPVAGRALQPLLGLPVSEEAYSFTHGKFYSGSAWLDGRANFEKAKAELLKTYGEPAFSNPNLELYKWKWPGSKVEVHLSYQAKFQRTTVTYANNAI